MISEGANIKLLTEASCVGFGFEGLDLVTNALVSSAACPFGLGRHWFVDVWPTAKSNETQFRGGEAFTADLIVFLGRVQRSVAVAASVIAVVAE